MVNHLALSAVLLTLLLRVPPVRAETPAELVEQARAALRNNQPKAAIQFLDQALAQDANLAAAYALRGEAHDRLADYAVAVRDYSRAIELVPDAAQLYDRRGSAQFRLGKIGASIDDFDKFLELAPDEQPGHWRRGISYYYAGRFKEGYRQFAAYQTVDQNDVENAVWHYLCYAKEHGAEAARQVLLPVGRDRRVPMMTVYELFRGHATPDDVLAAAGDETVPPNLRAMATFYAHLYLGLYYESADDAERSLEHMRQAAAALEQGGYMWDVARVHVMLRGADGTR